MPSRCEAGVPPFIAAACGLVQGCRWRAGARCAGDRCVSRDSMEAPGVSRICAVGRFVPLGTTTVPQPP